MRYERLDPMTFIGLRSTTSINNDKTYQLWSSFMPRRREIKQAIGVELYSIGLYPENYFNRFDPAKCFEKWAAVKVGGDQPEVPKDMEMLKTPEGDYAVFTHIGPIEKSQHTFEYIFREWFPQSPYSIDQRPHFAVMDERYNPEHEDSEEDIWIPIKAK